MHAQPAVFVGDPDDEVDPAAVLRADQLRAGAVGNDVAGLVAARISPARQQPDVLPVAGVGVPALDFEALVDARPAAARDRGAQAQRAPDAGPVRHRVRLHRQQRVVRDLLQAGAVRLRINVGAVRIAARPRVRRRRRAPRIHGPPAPRLRGTVEIEDRLQRRQISQADRILRLQRIPVDPGVRAVDENKPAGAVRAAGRNRLHAGCVERRARFRNRGRAERMRIGRVVRVQLVESPLVDRAVERPQRQPQVRGRVGRELISRVAGGDRVVRVQMQRHAAVGQQLEPGHVDRAAAAHVAGADLFVRPLIRVGSVHNHRVVAVRARRRLAQPGDARRLRRDRRVEQTVLARLLLDRQRKRPGGAVAVAVRNPVGQTVCARRRRRVESQPRRQPRLPRQRIAQRAVAARARRHRARHSLPRPVPHVGHARQRRPPVRQHGGPRHRHQDRMVVSTSVGGVVGVGEGGGERERIGGPAGGIGRVPGRVPDGRVGEAAAARAGRPRVGDVVSACVPRCGRQADRRASAHRPAERRDLDRRRLHNRYGERKRCACGLAVLVRDRVGDRIIAFRRRRAGDDA